MCMKKALSVVPMPLGIFFAGRLLFIGASSLNEHDKILNTGKEVVAFKSNRSGEWYVLPRYRLLLSRHMLERIARRQSLWKYWFGKNA